MITLIGTGHVFDLSNALIELFESKNPEVICVELDRQRYNALIVKKTNPELFEKSRKNLPMTYKMLAKFQDSMADEYGVEAGSEMITAINYGQSHGILVEFIDMNAQQLFIKMWKSMPFFEKFRLILSGFGGFFVSKEKVEKEMKNLEGNLDSYLEEIGKKFPTIKKVLIDDRNKFMANKIVSLLDNHKNIVSCMGDGHIPGISKILESKDIEFETIRLSKLRNMKPKEGDSTSASFSINYKPS